MTLAEKEIVKSSRLLDFLPEVRGKYRESAPLAKSVWFQTGGNAEVLYKPEDAEDLLNFFSRISKEIPIQILGVGSNIIIRDGGISGVTIKLGRNFTNIEILSEQNGIVLLKCGAATLNSSLTSFCIENEIGGLEFLSGIPGCIGGALAMNAGAYNKEVKDVLSYAQLALRDGSMVNLSVNDLRYKYRKSNHPEGAVFLSGVFVGYKQDKAVIAANVADIQKKREESQPIRSRTGGSTFKNPEQAKAWELIDRCGLRGYKLGGAMVSEKHCNFMINTGDATSSDIENLGEFVRKKVMETTGISLEWEIKRIGNA